VSIRNSLLNDVLVAYGGSDSTGKPRNTILNAILAELGGVVSHNTLNEILNDILVQIGGVATNEGNRNSSIEILCCVTL
jgi:hypothetical protein